MKQFLTYCLFLSLASAMVVNCGGSRQKQTAAAEEGFQSLFDGKTLDGWEFDSTYWSVRDGVMVGEITPETILKRNSFIIKKDLILKDFEMKVEYRISETGNSGLSYRNAAIDTLPYALAGYQADIDGRNFYTGQNYEEQGRQFLALRGQTTVIETGHVSPTSREVREQFNLTNDSLSRHIKKGEWNEYRIVAKGNRLQHYVNDVLMSDVTDNDTINRRMEGVFGVQVHVGPPMKIEYRNFRVKTLE
jgi:hypothetical protein